MLYTILYYTIQNVSLVESSNVGYGPIGLFFPMMTTIMMKFHVYEVDIACRSIHSDMQQ
jgi:hypothetical protein